MAQLSHEIEKFILGDPSHSTSSVHVFLAHPTPVELRTFGELFLIVEVSSKTPMDQEIIGIIQDEMTRAYYQAAQMRMEIAFEQALQRVNEQLRQLIESGVTDWVDHFGIIIGALKDRSLVMTHIGQIQAMLLHNNRIIDIVSSAGPEDRKLNPLKVFSNVISGEVQEDDYLIIFTPSLLDYLSQEKLKRLILDRTPAEAVRQLEDLLQDAALQTTFGAFIVHSVSSLEATVTPATTVEPVDTTRLTGSTQTSMEALVAREQATNRLLAPSPWLTIRQLFRALGRQASAIIPRRQSRRRRLLPQSEQTAPESIRAADLLAASRQGLSSLTSTSVRNSRQLGRLLASAFHRRRSFLESLRSIPERTVRFVASIVNSFPRWSFRRKALAVIIVILLFFFAQSIVTLGRKQEQRRLADEQTSSIATITDKTFQAEAALSYDDEARASRLLAEASDLAAALVAKQKKGTTNIELDKAQSEIERLKEQTRHLVRIDEPTILADLKGQAGFSDARSVARLGSNLYLADHTSNAIFAVDLNNGDVSETPNDLPELGTPLLSAPFTANSLLVYHSSDNFYQFTPSIDRIRALPYTSLNVEKTIVGLATYQSRAYLLDTKNNQVVRYQAGATNFGLGAAWIQDDEHDVTNGVSIAVDGSIYVLSNAGSLSKFTQGRAVDFSLQTIDPLLNSGTKIWTDEAVNSIYLLDRSSQRLIVFTKSGKLRVQFTSAAFTDLRDLAVDETADRAYLLNGSTIYSVDLNT